MTGTGDDDGEYRSCAEEWLIRLSYRPQRGVVDAS